MTQENQPAQPVEQGAPVASDAVQQPVAQTAPAAPAPAYQQRDSRGGGGGGGRGGRGGPGRGRGGPRRDDRGGDESGIESSVVRIYRCSKVVKGGRTFSFGALVVAGDRKGNIGIGYGK